MPVAAHRVLRPDSMERICAMPKGTQKSNKEKRKPKKDKAKPAK